MMWYVAGDSIKSWERTWRGAGDGGISRRSMTVFMMVVEHWSDGTATALTNASRSHPYENPPASAPFLLFAPAASILLAQASVPAAEPFVVDVHASAYRPSINVTVNISKRVFDMRNATIVNMIDFALGQRG